LPPSNESYSKDAFDVALIAPSDVLVGSDAQDIAAEPHQLV